MECLKRWVAHSCEARLTPIITGGVMLHHDRLSHEILGSCDIWSLPGLSDGWESFILVAPYET